MFLFLNQNQANRKIVSLFNYLRAVSYLQVFYIYNFEYIYIYIKIIIYHIKILRNLIRGKRLKKRKRFDLSDEIKQEFFQAVVMSVLLYHGTTWI